jgi:DNA-binding PadR family transcriptional regulator
MIEQELLLLGLLRESPKHGYDIKIQVREILSLFAGVKLCSVYYPLKVLEKKGLIKKKIAKVGKRPQRMVYALTGKGKARFEELLSKSILELKRPQFSLDLSLYFLHYLNPASARRRLRARLRLLNKVSSGFSRVYSALKRKHPALSGIMEHNLTMLEAETRFLSSAIAGL